MDDNALIMISFAKTDKYLHIMSIRRVRKKKTPTVNKNQ